MSNITTLIVLGAVMFAVLGGITLLSHIYSLNNIKSKTLIMEKIIATSLLNIENIEATTPTINPPIMK